MIRDSGLVFSAQEKNELKKLLYAVKGDKVILSKEGDRENEDLKKIILDTLNYVLKEMD